MSKSMFRIGAVLAMAFLLMGSAVAFAQEEEMAEKTLTGQLTVDDNGTYFLIEEASGAEVRLVGSADLASHVDANVTVTGSWGSDDSGEYFEVSSIEPAA